MLGGTCLGAFDDSFDAVVGSLIGDVVSAHYELEGHSRELDREATRLGVTRRSLIKVWIAEKLDEGNQPAA